MHLLLFTKSFNLSLKLVEKLLVVILLGFGNIEKRLDSLVFVTAATLEVTGELETLCSRVSRLLYLHLESSPDTLDLSLHQKISHDKVPVIHVVHNDLVMKAKQQLSQVDGILPNLEVLVLMNPPL